MHDTYARTSRTNRVWACGALACLVVFADMVAYAGLVPLIPTLVSDHLGASPAMTGALVSAYAAGLLVTTPIFGLLVDRRVVPRRTLMSASLAGLTVSSVLYTICNTYWHYFAARILQGVAAAGNWTVALAIAADGCPETRLGTLMGVISAAWNLGNLLGPAVAGLAYEFSPFAPFIMFASLSGVALVASLVIVREPSPETPVEHVTLWSLATRPAMAANCAVVLVAGGCAVAFEPVLPLWLTATFNTSVTTNGLAFLAFALATLVVSPVVGHLCDRVREPRAFVVMGLILTALATPLVALMPTLPAALAALVLFGAFETLAMTPVLPDMGRHAKHAAGQVYALFNFTYSVAMFAGPAAAGALYEYSGLFVCLSAFGGMCLAVAACYAVYVVRTPRSALSSCLDSSLASTSYLVDSGVEDNATGSPIASKSNASAAGSPVPSSLIAHYDSPGSFYRPPNGSLVSSTALSIPTATAVAGIGTSVSGVTR